MSVSPLIGITSHEKFQPLVNIFFGQNPAAPTFYTISPIVIFENNIIQTRFFSTRFFCNLWLNKNKIKRCYVFDHHDFHQASYSAQRISS